eukprot:5035706-Pyramimonas_sp.AAC.1
MFDNPRRGETSGSSRRVSFLEKERRSSVKRRGDRESWYWEEEGEEEEEVLWEEEGAYCAETPDSLASPPKDFVETPRLKGEDEKERRGVAAEGSRGGGGGSARALILWSVDPNSRSRGCEAKGRWRAGRAGGVCLLYTSDAADDTPC